MTAVQDNIPTTDAALTEERWREYELAKDFLKMLAYGGAEFYLELPLVTDGDAFPGRFHVKLSAVDPATLEDPEGRAMTRIIAWHFPLHLGSPYVPEAAPTGEETPGG